MNGRFLITTNINTPSGSPVAFPFVHDEIRTMDELFTKLDKHEMVIGWKLIAIDRRKGLYRRERHILSRSRIGQVSEMRNDSIQIIEA